MNLTDLRSVLMDLTDRNRPLRLRMWNQQGIVQDLLLVKQVHGVETMCGGLTYHVLCVAHKADLELKQFMAMPAELQFVTARGALRSVCGIVDGVEAGEADGGLATYQLIVRDALSIMDQGSTSRIFRNMNEIDITQQILSDWRRANPVLGRAFDFETWRLKSSYPQREFTFQYNESDAAFLRRLWQRRGLSWFFQPSRMARDAAPAHTLILFDDAWSLAQNAAGDVRYHRDDGTEVADSITAWHAARNLTPSRVIRQSWDYKTAGVMHSAMPSNKDQGALGNQLAADMVDGLIETPHMGDDRADSEALAKLRMQRHEFESKCFHGKGGLRDLCPGQWISMTGHAEIDRHPPPEREFVITELRVAAENNLPKVVSERADRLFARNRWDTNADVSLMQASSERDGRYTTHFTCVRRGIAIVPAFDPRLDLPRTAPCNAVVIGPEGESVYCDAMGRVRVRFPGCRPEERAGRFFTPNDAVTEHDSAWVRVSSTWAGAKFGVISLPRVGHCVVVSFIGGDPDKPIITSAVHGGSTPPPSFSHVSSLSGDRYLSGIVSQEIGGNRSNQLRIDDTTGQISAQLASDHGATQLNLGYLTHPRSAGRAKARGEGFELTSNDSGSIRTAKSLLISAWKRLDACGNQLSGEEHLALMQDCLDLFKSLGQYAFDNQALALDAAPQAELQKDIKAAAAGSNTDPQGIGGKPTLSITAPDGIAMSTPKTMVSYAGVNVDMVAQQHLQFTSGQRFNLNAGQGISLFSHHNGIKAIAHYGKLLLQSQHDDTEINASKHIKMTATDGIITLIGKEIHLIAEDGSFTKIGGGGISHGTNGEIKNQAARFPFSGPATMHAELPTFGGGTPDQKFAFNYLPNSEDGAIAGKRQFNVGMNDDSTLKGASDAVGKTSLLERDAMHLAKVSIFTDKK